MNIKAVNQKPQARPKTKGSKNIWKNEKENTCQNK